ncbi:MAG: 50S ribosomal protein L25/general stress protein Ctc [Desulfuromonadales bacterium]
MAQADLKVTARPGTGKGSARSLRRQGLAPAVVYGKGIEPCPVALVPKELEKVIAGEAGWNTLINLQGEGAFAGRTVILKDMQLDPIRREIMHVDFQVIDRQKKVHVMVPVHPVGKSVGEKEGGNLQVIRYELEVVTFPDSIPAAIEVDVTALEIGDVLHIEDLVLPEGVVAPHDVNFTVITVTGHKGEEEVTETEETPV